MARALRRSLAGLALPGQPAVPFLIDAVAGEAGVRLILAGHPAAQLAFAGAELRRAGEPAGAQAIAPLARGQLIDLAPGTTLRIGSEALALDPQPVETALFAGRRALLAHAVGPDPARLADWLAWHQATQGADAAVLVRRLGPGDDPAPEPLLAAARGVAGIARFVLLDCALPLGDPKAPDQRALILAEGAPGRGEMAPPPADPWRAPLAETGLLEAVRLRFLAAAAAVLRADLSDLVEPPAEGGASVFDAALAGPGFIRLLGRQVYPWQNAPGRAAAHADHSAHAFDGRAAPRLWCLAPGINPEAGAWREHRVTGVAERAIEPPPGYWRCMGVRHPGHATGKLAPKSALVPTPGLAAAIGRVFGRTPKAPPPAEAGPVLAAMPIPAPAPALAPRVLIVTTMKNEGPFILEWLAYHRAIGVTDVLVYTNDCSDGTDALFDRLAERGLVRHLPNPYRATGEKPQHAAYLDASDRPEVAEADWVIGMDVDEFINIHVGAGRLADLFAAVPEATMISLTWRLFGNSDVEAFEDHWISEQMTWAAREDARKPHQAWGFKTLFRPLGHFRKLGVHRPKGLRAQHLPAIRWVNGSGRPMPEAMIRTGWRSTSATIGYGLAQLNHYAVRSVESFLVKRDRGRVNHVDRDQGLSYWFRMNHNVVEDRSILARLPMARAEYARLVADPATAELHARAVSAHRAKIAELRAQPDHAALAAEIAGDRMRALSRLTPRFGNAVFLKGPEAVPPDFHLAPAADPAPGAPAGRSPGPGLAGAAE